MSRGIIELRVRYGETDTAGVVYHANYLQYFEMGRTELMRSLGAPYSAMEAAGTMLTVIDADLKFRRPAHYDDLLEVETRLTDVSGARVRFSYEVRRAESGEVLCTGSTGLGAIDGATGRACRLPASLREVLL